MEDSDLGLGQEGGCGKRSKRTMLRRAPRPKFIVDGGPDTQQLPLQGGFHGEKDPWVQAR